MWPDGKKWHRQTRKASENATDSHTLPSRIGLEGANDPALVYLHLRTLSPLVQPLVAMQRKSAQNGPKCAPLMGISWVLNSQQMLTTLWAIAGTGPTTRSTTWRVMRRLQGFARAPEAALDWHHGHADAPIVPTTATQWAISGAFQRS